jgi:hypothetical protein
MAMKIDNKRASETAWGDVDKGALGSRLADAYAAGDATKAQIREAYAFVPEDAFGTDGDGKPKFASSTGWGPHHVLDGDTLIAHRGGVQGAAGALAGARSQPSLSAAEQASARRHIRGHYRELKMEAPDSLKESGDGEQATRFVERLGAGIELLEAEAGKPRRLKAVGITADVVNGNGRRYPAHVLRAAVDELRDHLHESAGQGRLVQLLGEAEHPSDKSSGRPNLLETVVRWSGADLVGQQVLLDGVLLETAKGKDILALLEGGVRPGISQRGYGRSRRIEEGDQRIEEVMELTITGYDLVMEPSDPEAQVTMLESGAIQRIAVQDQGQDQGDEKMDANELAEMIKAHPEMFKGIVADQVKEMSEAQRADLEKSIRAALGVEESADLVKALTEAAQAREQVKAEAQAKALAEAVAAATKDLPYGKLNALFVSELAESVHDAGEVAARAAGLRKRYDALVAAARLATMGREVEVLGPVIEREAGVPEFARASLAFTESMVKRGIASRRNLRESTKINDVMALRVLQRFDEVYKLPLMREAQLQETELASDLNLPYSVSRAILAEVWPTLVATSIFDVDTTDQSPTRVYYEDYQDVSGKHVAITNDPFTSSFGVWVALAHKMIQPGTLSVDNDGGTTYVEGTDYVVDYLDGKVMALAGATIADSTHEHADYHYDAVREGENTEIQRGKTVLAYGTLDCLANRLATQITNEAIVFSRSQMGWDATARTLAMLVAELRREIDAALMFNALSQALKVATNSGGTYTASTDPLIDLVSYLGVAKVKVEKRYFEPTFFLLSSTNSDALGNWDGFTAAGSRNDVALNANGYVGRVKGLPVFKSTEFSDAYALVGNRQVVHYRIYQPMTLKGPYPSYGTNRLLIAADQWYAEQYDGALSPVAGKASYVKIA